MEDKWRSEIPLSFNGIYKVAVAVQRQRVIHTENSGFASPTLGQHISTFRGYRILFSIRNPWTTVNPVIYPSINTILCVLLNMPASTATAKMSFSVLRRLATCGSSAIKNDRLSSLGLMHIHRDFEVDLYNSG
jgi:hypothetical protein